MKKRKELEIENSAYSITVKNLELEVENLKAVIKEADGVNLKNTIKGTIQVLLGIGAWELYLYIF